MTFTIERAVANDLPGIEALLTACELPLDGVRDTPLTAIVARDDNARIVGCSALELYADGALLRSVAVDARVRGQRIASALVERALTEALRAGQTSVYLLTTTAEPYFTRRRFARIDRADVPASVQQSIEFRSACPASATVMKRALVPARVVFACIQNAGRSQMAQALFNRAADPRVAYAHSAGTHPGLHVHANVAAAMLEQGIDISANRPTRLTSEWAAGTDWLITLGCGEQCPVIPGAKRDDWPIADPKDADAAGVRLILDDVAARVSELIARNGWQRQGA